MVFKFFSGKLKLFYAQQIQSPNSSNAQSVKNITYLILSELVEENVASSTQYFDDFLKISLMKQYNPKITVESIVWIEEALKCKSITAYENKPERFQELLEFVEQCPQMIGIECSLALKYEDSKKKQFMEKHKPEIQ
jgi:hypothetical protein